MLDEAQLALMGTVLPRGRNVRRLVRVAFHLLLERGGNVGQFVYELDQVADVIAAALGATSPATSTAKAKYRIDPRIAQACRDRCEDLLAHHLLYPEIAL